jgi:hypothetical protein
VLQQLFGFRIVGRKLQGALDFGARQIGFFLLEVDSREHGAHQRGVAGLERSLQFLNRVIELAAPVTDFAQAAKSGRVRWFRRYRGARRQVPGARDEYATLRC